MKVKKKYIKNTDGEKIASVIHSPDNEFKGSVLLQHGFFSDKEGEWERRANTFAEEGFRAIRFDRRGYGESDREFHEFNLTTGIQDTKTIIDYLEKEGEKKFGIYGSSFGGLIALHAVTIDSRIDALALRAPVTYLENLFTENREITKKEGEVSVEEEMPGAKIKNSFFEDLNTYDAKSAAEKISVPTIIFHGTEDEIVPINDSKRFYQELEVEKAMVEVDGGGHVFSTEQDQRVLNRAAEWFSKYFE